MTAATISPRRPIDPRRRNAARGVIAYGWAGPGALVFAAKEEPSLRESRLKDEKMQASIELMCNSDAAGGMLARMGHQLTHYVDKELASTLTTTLRYRVHHRTAEDFCASRMGYQPDGLLSRVAKMRSLRWQRSSWRP